MAKFFPRIRFLPITIFAAVLMLTVKIGAIWGGIDGLWDGAIAVAGAKAQQPSAAPSATAPPPAIPLQPPAGSGTAPDPGTAPPDSGGAPPSAATEAAATSKPPSTPMGIDDPTLLTQAEIDLLQQLAERREVIEKRERELEVRSGMLAAAESRIDKKIEEMKVLQATIEQSITTYDEQQAAKMASLVKIYENMKPKDAARIFEELDMDTLLLVAERMKERSLAPIMANMDPGRARDITVDLSRRRQLPQEDAVAGG